MVLGLAAATALLSVSPASAATIQVNTLGDGSSASFCTLRQAIQAAVTNAVPAASNCVAGQAGTVDVIRLGVLNGDYTLNGTGDETNAAGDLDILSPGTDAGLQIVGDLDGGGLPLDRINGSGTDRVIDIKTPYPVTLDSVGIQGGRGVEGAGVMIQQFTDVTLKHVVIRNNQDGVENSVGGGLLALQGATVHITDSTIGGTTAGDANTARVGAGIASGATTTIVRSRIVGNNATVAANGSASAILAGGLSVSAGTTTVTDSSIEQNKVTANEATDSEKSGGIDVENGALVLRNSTVSGNELAAGGSIAEGAGMIVSGGSGSTVSVINSTIANNVVQAGAGARDLAAIGYNAISGSMLLDHATISGNSPTASSVSGDPDITLRGTVINQGLSACPNTFNVTNAYNWDAGSSCVGAASDTDMSNGTGLNLSALSNNGGATQTMALGAGSSAVDLEPLGACHDLDSSPLTSDQRGVGRPFGAGCDAGAFEVASCQGQSPTITSNAPGTLNGTSAGDVIAGSGGDDTIDPGGGSDTGCASSGDDTVIANDGVADVIDCGPGTDSYRADAADTLISCETNLAPSGGGGGGGGGMTATCAGFPATIVGTPGNDTLTGTPGDDVIAAQDGNDVVLGGGGNDRVCGGPGNDVLKGNGGNDTLFGEAGKDKLLGGGGRKDVCKGGAGMDSARTCEVARSL